MVGHDETTVDAPAAAGTAQLHPAAGEGVGVVAEAAQPGRALGRGRRQHQRGLEHRGIDAFVGHPVGVRQRHAGGAVDRVERLHRAVHHDRPDAAVDPVQHPLGLAEAVAEQHRRAAGGGVGAPPGVDVGEQHRLGRPAVDRQAEGRFGDEGVAAHRLERRAGAVVFHLVVARRHPDPAAVLQPHLGRPEDMARRVQRDLHPVVLEGLAVGQRLQVDVGAQPGAQRALAVGLRQVVRMAPAGMVGVRMGDDRPLHRLPGVDVEIARRAVQAFGTGDDEVHAGARQPRSTAAIRHAPERRSPMAPRHPPRPCRRGRTVSRGVKFGGMDRFLGQAAGGAG